VEVPHGNDAMTSPDPSTADLPAPTITTVPSKYPFRSLAINGNATNAARVILSGAGNPLSANVDPIDGKFCLDVDLPTSPADYTLTIEGQSTDGRLSKSTSLHVIRSNDAPAPTNAQLCDGTPVGN
jgi:hypothetical protein